MWTLVAYNVRTTRYTEGMSEMRTRWMQGGLIVVMLVVMTGCQKQAGPSTAPTADTELANHETVVSVTGKVLPTRWADLSFGMAGRVEEILVVEEQRVEAGQVLARLDTSELDAAVLQAEAALGVAQAELARVEAGARPQEIRAAEAAVQAAQEGVLGAEAAVAVAEGGVTAAQATLASARAGLALAQAKPRPEELELARQQVEMAKAERYAAQNTRDALGGRVGTLGYQIGAHESAEGQAMAAENRVTMAELSMSLLKQGARPEQVAISAARVGEAQAALALAHSQVAVAAQQAAAQQTLVRQAQAQLDLVRAGARAEEVALARARVAQAEAGLEQARAALQRAIIVAPYAGAICQINVRLGEQAMPGLPAIALGDLTTLRVETTDLDEIDVARVAVGRQTQITFDALPNAKVRGTVERLALKAGAGSGGAVFKAIIAFDEADPRLRWGMTAFVDIPTE